jgi:hypothetical protein
MTTKTPPTLQEILEDKELAERYHFLEDGTAFLPAQLLHKKDTKLLQQVMGFFGDVTPADTWLRAWWLMNEFVRRRGEGLELAWVNAETNEVEIAEYDLLTPGVQLNEESE